jgi:hypothetical protein
MAADDKKAKPTSAPKKESTAAPAPSKAAEATPAKTADAATAKPADAKPAGGDTTAATPASYSRGEGQKPVTQAYKDNWNAIFATKNSKLTKKLKKTAAAKKTKKTPKKKR